MCATCIRNGGQSQTNTNEMSITRYECHSIEIIFWELEVVKKSESIDILKDVNPGKNNPTTKH